MSLENTHGLVKGLKPEDFGKKSMPRNAKVADLLHRVEYIERMGTGINKIRRLMDEAGLPPVEFEFDTFFTATFTRPESGKSEDVELEPDEFSEKFREDFSVRFNEILRHEGVSEGVQSRLANEIAYIATQGYLKRTDIEKHFNISTATAERELSMLKRLGIIVFEGTPKAGVYILTEKGKKIVGGKESGNVV